MFNIERELELFAGGDERYTLHEILSHDEHEIRAKTYYRGSDWDIYTFCPKTGVMRGHENMDTGAWRLRPKSEMRPTDHFFLHTGVRDWEKDHWVKIESENHPNGAAAAEKMKDYNAKASDTDSPYRFIVKKETELSPIRDYESWAKERFETGEWTKLPWADEPWASSIAYHYAHVSKADDSMVAFWASEADAQVDRVTVMAPGRYLNQYFSNYLTANEIRDWAVKLDAECEVKFVTEPQDIVDIYVQAGTGCMRYADESRCNDGCTWRSGLNPTRIYGAGDLAVAYLERKGKIIARALAWPEKKALLRIYGDVERMRDAFTGMGWNFDSDDHSAHSQARGLFEGARLLKIRPDNNPYNWLMPYIDFGYRVREEDDYFIMSKTGPLYANHTDGLLYEHGGEPDRPRGERWTPPSCWDANPEDEDYEFCCAHCDEYSDEDYTCYVNGVDETWCDGCASEYTSCCEQCGNRYRDADMISTEGGSSYCPAHSHLVNSCDYCGDYYHVNNLRNVLDGEGDHHGDACEYCFENDSSIVTDRNGRRVARDTVTECDSCETFYSNDLDDCPCTENEEVEPA